MVCNPRSRIVRHVRVRASDLVPHELNPRLHSKRQRAALAALYDEIGFARSLLAYQLADGRLKLIDGHLRRDLTPDLEVDVEVLDVTDAEARALLLSLDPLAALADYDAQAVADLRQITETSQEAVAQLWETIGQANARVRSALDDSEHAAHAAKQVPAQYLVLIECRDEEEQVQMLERFQGEGLRCRALVS